MVASVVGIPTVDNTRPVSYINVVPMEPSVLGSAPGNSSGGSPEVVKDGMEIGCVDPKVVEEMEEPVSIITKSFVSLVTIEAAKSKVKFHDILIVAFTTDGLSMMDTKLVKGRYGYCYSIVKDDGEVLYMVRLEYEWEPPRCVSRKVVSSANPFDVLNTIEEGDELGSNGARLIQAIKLSKMWLVRHLVA
ncbi:hypothetical protein Tco_1564259 [Tanacetum coccineum]